MTNKRQKRKGPPKASPFGSPGPEAGNSIRSYIVAGPGLIPTATSSQKE